MQSRKVFTPLGTLFQASLKNSLGFYLSLYFFTLRISFINQGCLFTSCINGGSCLPDKKTQTFSCACLPRWTGDRCEVKLGNNDMTVIKHNWKVIAFHDNRGVNVFKSLMRLFYLGCQMWQALCQISSLRSCIKTILTLVWNLKSKLM